VVASTVTAAHLVSQLLALPDPAAQQQFLRAHRFALDDEVAQAIKTQADTFLHADVQRALQLANALLYIAELTGNPLHQALGLLAEANARSIGLAEYSRSIELYNEAARIYHEQNRPVDEARSQIGKLTALGRLGRHDEVTATAKWAAEILEAHGEWLLLAKLIVNQAAIQDRLWESARVLELYDRAAELYGRIGVEGKPNLARVEVNRAIALRNLGRFESSIQTNLRAIEMLTQTGQTVELARAQQNLGMTYFVLGRHNDALQLLEQAQRVFLKDGRHRDTILIELYLSACLLQLRRFADVLEKSSQARDLFSKLGTPFEAGQAVLNEAAANAGLDRFGEALDALAEARRFFEADGNAVWVARTDLERAVVHLRRHAYTECLATALECARIFDGYEMPVERAQAHLVAAQAAAALDQQDEASRLAKTALAVSQEKELPDLAYQARCVIGALARRQGDFPQALAEYDQAIQAIERLRGQMMVEFRAGFLEDKQQVYEDAVELCLDLNRPQDGMGYAERAKSRALLDLLAYRIDLRVRPRDAEDADLVDEFLRLREEQDRLVRRWEGDPQLKVGGWTSPAPDREQVQQRLHVLERQITAQWHKLLVRNADYARDAALWQVQAEPVRPRLAPDTLLLEYFVVHGRLIAFLVSERSVQAVNLPVAMAQVEGQMARLSRNTKTAPHSAPEHLADLTAKAQALLRQLHTGLIAPFNEVLASYPRLLVVPHGSLHYLPFHALYDGETFLVERHEISYLPSAGLLRYMQPAQTADGLSPAEGVRGRSCLQAAVFGHSQGGRLPYAVEEARSIANLLDGELFLEEQATLAQVQRLAAGQSILHLATHGEFSRDNPLFSGLALDDGWLYTLDVFNLRLQASLVTLSACQTGQHVVGGGDELLGLMRAFLYAGAASLVLSQWAVWDYSTRQLMESFYQNLAAGRTKGDALRQAQLRLLHAEDGGRASEAKPIHPYFWAPFFLVGDAGLL
jgi:CHAT domain-containing protein/tetratricopeptide (TPR) repeat protein